MGFQRTGKQTFAVYQVRPGPSAPELPRAWEIAVCERRRHEEGAEARAQILSDTGGRPPRQLVGGLANPDLHANQDGAFDITGPKRPIRQKITRSPAFTTVSPSREAVIL